MLKIDIISLLLVVVDSAAKYFSSAYLKHQPIIITHWLSITYTENRGVAWSLPLTPPIILIVSCLLIGIIHYYADTYCYIENKITRYAFALLIGGALGNLIDRIMRGFVIDFIAFSFWPVFNLADIFIVAGVFLIILFYGKIVRSQKKVS